MPNKTIYIPDESLAIFERAAQLAGISLSATIVEALKHYVQRQEALMSGYQPVEVEVGGQIRSRKRFNGRLIARGNIGLMPDQSHPERVFEKFEVYHTIKNNFVVMRKLIAHHEPHAKPTITITVCESRAALQEHLPAKLFAQVVDAFEHPDVEELDI